MITGKLQITCPTCQQVLDVPLRIISAADSVSPGHAVVTVEAEPEFLDAHNQTHQPDAKTIRNIAPLSPR